MRLSFVVLAFGIISAAPMSVATASAHEYGRYWGGRDQPRIEVFERDGCRIERTWRSDGRAYETVDCGRRGSRGYIERVERDRDWDGRRWEGRARDDRYVDSGWGRSGYSDWDERRYIGSYFNDDQRRIVGGYLGRDCHPWRSDWRRPYRVGDVFPSRYGWRPIPHDLYGRLAPPPRGYSYVQVDSDVLLIREATRLVIDAIVLGDRAERRDRRW